MLCTRRCVVKERDPHTVATERAERGQIAQMNTIKSVIAVAIDRKEMSRKEGEGSKHDQGQTRTPHSKTRTRLDMAPY